MDDFLAVFRSYKAGEIGTITSAIIGLVLLFFFFLNFYSDNKIIPPQFTPYFLTYFVYQIGLLLVMSISDFVKSLKKSIPS